jgi:thiosulfate reductase cytochrome b subunit
LDHSLTVLGAEQDPMMRALPARVVVALLMLCLPYVVLGAWLERARGWHSVAAFLASVGLLTFALAQVARTWRRFLLLQFPLWLLGAAFAGYVQTFDMLPVTRAD